MTISPQQFFEYMQIYKNYYKHPYCHLLCEDIKLSSHILGMFNDSYNTYNELQSLISNCISNNIHTFNDFNTLIYNHIRNTNHIFDNPVFNDIPQQTPKFVAQYGVKQSMQMYKQIGHTYLSIDIKHAFSQYIDSLKLFDKSFDALVLSGLPEFMQQSKVIRMQLYYQIMDHFRLRHNIACLFDDVLNADDELITILKANNIQLVTYNFDELIFDITNYLEFDRFLGNRTINDIQLSISKFIPHSIKYIDPESSSERTLHIREYTDNLYYVEKFCKYISYLHKIHMRRPIEYHDLYYVNNDNQICKLNEPIKIIEII